MIRWQGWSRHFHTFSSQTQTQIGPRIIRCAVVRANLPSTLTLTTPPGWTTAPSPSRSDTSSFRRVPSRMTVTHVWPFHTLFYLPKVQAIPPLSVKYTADESKGASISGGPLNGSYTLNQFHLHWGSKPGQGSEHTVNGKRLVWRILHSPCPNENHLQTYQLPISLKGHCMFEFSPPYCYTLTQAAHLSQWDFSHRTQQELVCTTLNRYFHLILILFQLWCRIASCPLQIHIWQHRCCGCLQRKWCPRCCRNPHTRGIHLGSACSRQALSNRWDAEEGRNRAIQGLEGTRCTISWFGSYSGSFHLWNHVS